MRTTLGQWFDHALRVNAARSAVEWHDGELTYGDLDVWSRAIAAELEESGVQQGDAVALLVGNDPAFVACDIAVARLGAVKLPVNPLLPPPTVAHILRDASPRVLVVGPGLEDLARRSLDELPVDDSAAVVVQRGGEGEQGLTGARVLPSERDESSPATALARPDGDAPAALYYTGGTTGQPKGVVHSQRSTVALHVAQLLEAEIRQHDRLLLQTPLAHAAGLFAQSAVLRGATIVLRDGFDVDRTLADLRDQGVTWTFLVPTMIYRLLDRLGGDAKGFSQLETVVYGAAPISPTRLEQALGVFGQVFVQLYGQTECPNWGTRLTKSDHVTTGGDRLASCGQASLFVDVRIVDDNGEDVDIGGRGEICLRSPYTLSRYHRNEQATAEKFLGEWIRTGDIGELDDDGYLYLKDRRADMIITGGMNVYCREVEDVLNAHPHVRQAAVIGVPHDDWGEAVHAVIVPGDALEPEQLLTWARERLAGYARPKTVEVVEALPETPFGKIDKKKLREQHWTGADRAIN